MSVFKCKMCGGTLSVEDGVSVAECEYCGTKQTLPTSNDDVIVNLFNRANNLRLKSEYDKAAEVYEKILEINDSLAEAHWGLVLCKYGVEYVEDPLTKERIPTCHRTQLASILTDAEYQAALKYADATSRELYEQQAHEINELQKKILEIVKSEKPFDVFICYKETDESGARTKDSVIANEIYHELTNSGLKVFYSAITLEDKLGQEYEPYIFAALTSAKVMLVLGTKPEYFNAVWVKNEWSRYLHLMKTDRQTKRTLIPCFRDMDAYDLPDEFSHLQALDMANIAFMPDLTRNIRKLIGTPVQSAPQSVPVAEPQTPAVQVESLLKRAFLFIEDGEYERADKLLEEVLNLNPESAKAYVGKLLIAYKFRTESELASAPASIADDKIFKRACKCADDEYRKILQNYSDAVVYKHALLLKEQEKYEEAEKAFSTITKYKDAKEQQHECFRLRKEVLRLETEERLAQLRKQEQEREREKVEAEKKKKRLIVIGVIALLIIGAAVFAVWYIEDNRLGSAKNPIILSTPEDLMAIDSIVSQDKNKFNYYVLNNDINMDGYLWVPIGDSKHQFYGSINGQGHTISNLQIDASVLSDSKDSELGFIHTIHDDSSISFIKFKNVKISGTNGTEKVGVLAYKSYGNIQLCNVSGIYCSPVYGIGGIVYSLSSIANDEESFSGIYSSHVSGTLNNNCQAGGITCVMQESGTNIAFCSFSGSIVSDNPLAREYKNLATGGICGSSIEGFNIMNCDVTGTINGYGSVGGICGKSNGYSIGACTFNGNVNAELDNSEIAYAGGIIGYIIDYREYTNANGCTTSGSVSSNTKNINSNSGYSGAIVGYVDTKPKGSNVYSPPKVMYCTSSSTVYVSQNSLSQGISGNEYSGNYADTNDFTGSIKKR